ncbi:hypothetical protein [Scytonema sp. HK-05]|uniref:hypothetical protein n=1 Tax=Scytonema sp. HK-05 TaxID=1137095 RepID=UPI000937394F|nr:hypothetical protein [Scytonema sp. HK-05]OKH57678.1 hypothetical protein NIES2130_18325 [Scytonema sp. HK-05]
MAGDAICLLVYSTQGSLLFLIHAILSTGTQSSEGDAPQDLPCMAIAIRGTGIANRAFLAPLWNERN